MVAVTEDEKKQIHEFQNETKFEDEINLVDYLIVLWKKKYLILILTILPCAIMCTALHVLPREYKITYTYDINSWDFDEINYSLLASRFFGEENLKKLIAKLEAEGLSRPASRIKASSSQLDRLEKIVKFEVTPSFLDIAKLNASSNNKLNLKPYLLKVAIATNSKEDMFKTARVIRGNVEELFTLPVYRDQLTSAISNYNDQLADIESKRFREQLALRNNDEILTGLKKASVENPESKQSITIQLQDVNSQSHYLPLNYQIQAAEFKKIELQAGIKLNEEKYNYYKELLELNRLMLAELVNQHVGYTAQQFKSFLLSVAAECKKQELKDYVNAYIRQVENQADTSNPVTEKPGIYSVNKGLAKKIMLTAILSFLIATLAAFFFEGFEKRKALHGLM